MIPFLPAPSCTSLPCKRPTPTSHRWIAIFLVALLSVSTGATAKKHSKASRAHPAPSQADRTLYANRPEALQAADAIAQQTGLDLKWVRSTIGQARYLPGIAKAATPPAVGVAKNWSLYRSRFVEPQRIRAGLAFWQAHRPELERAERQTGVPAAIIVGIVGVETLFGKQMGHYRVMDALCTLAFDFPAAHPRATERAAFFRTELQALLELTHRTGTNPLALRGSYAGAMGLPQFMPSSWAKYAVDFDGDGRIDLFHSATDVIGSVANYFKAFGWKPGMPTHYAVTLPAEGVDMATLLAPDIRPTFSAQALQDKGAVLEGLPLLHEGPMALVELQDGNNPPLYLLGTENFYALTRYNWSSYYALAVIELGQAIQQALPENPP